MHNGDLYIYDGTWFDVGILMHHMQRIANPLITLNTGPDVINFLNTLDNTIYDGDYEGTLMAKG